MVAGRKTTFTEKEKEKDVRLSNVVAARAVADAVRTSLGPKGMDKMVQNGNGEVTITNDGATIVDKMEVGHPAARMLVELSHAQDIEAGDGTTTVVVICGALLGACQSLLEKGIHPTKISEAFEKAAKKAIEVLDSISRPIDLADTESLVKLATTSLSSKVVSQNSSLLAPIAVNSVMRVIDPATATNVDLRDIKIVKKLGGTVDDTELIDGLIFDQKASSSAGGPTRIEKAKIALIQFCISPPKTDLENQVVVNDYQQMDRVLKEEREYILNICKKIKQSGANVLLIQKSILRDAVSELSLHYLAKLKIMVVKDIERDDIDFICKTLGTKPIASPDALHADKLGKAELVEQRTTSGGKVISVTGVPNPGKTVSVFCRGSNRLMLDEADRSIHDALCVIRCLVKKRAILAGGGGAEVEIMQNLTKYAKTLTGVEAYCVRAFGEAFETVPYTLAENAGLDPMHTVTELRNRHEAGDTAAGINVRKGTITNMNNENVLQPLLVTQSAINLATETVRMLLKIDDILLVRS